MTQKTKRKQVENGEEDVYIVPELNVRVSKAWINLVHYCQTKFPYGDLTIRLVNAQPTELLDKKPKIRFDKELTIPVTSDDF